MQNSITMLNFFCFVTKNTLSGQMFSKNSKLFVQIGFWYLKLFNYGESSGGVYFPFSRSKTPSLGKFGPKNENCQSKLKIGT